MLFKRITNWLMPQPQKPELMPLLFGIEVESFCAMKPNKLDSDVQTYVHTQLAGCGLASKVEDLLEMLPAMKYRYLQWLLTTDSSLDADQARTEFDHRIFPKCAEGWRDPKVGGLELISPPLPVPDIHSATPAHQQVHMIIIGQYLKVLEGAHNGHAGHYGFCTETCGSHIHLGRPDNKAFPLDLLQYLANSIVKYELKINLLHPHSRTPYPNTQAAKYANSNRLGLLTDLHTCPNRSSFDLDGAKTKIFATTTVRELSSLMGAQCPADSPSEEANREAGTEWSNPTSPGAWTNTGPSGQMVTLRGVKYKTVRWELLGRADGEGPRTREFRQAAGTLNVEEIAHNIQLNTALVRAAERQVASTCEEVSEATPTIKGFLVDHLRLPDHAVKYWISRAARLAELRRLAQRDPEHLKRWQICQECCDLRGKRQLERNDRAAHEEGWQSLLPTGMTEAISSRKARRQAKRAARKKVAEEEARAWALQVKQEQELSRLWNGGDRSQWSQRVQQDQQEGLRAPLPPEVAW